MTMFNEPEVARRSASGRARRRGHMRFRTAAVLAMSAGALVVAPGAALAKSGPPSGVRANACHALHPGGSESVAGTYNVGNPAQVLIAGDCEGGDIGAVDDGLTVTVSHPSGSGGTLSHLFSDPTCNFVAGGPALDVTDLFKSGKHQVAVTVDDNPDCGPPFATTPLYLVVVQNA